MLKHANIPNELHGLIFLASRFGIADDFQRERAIRSASKEEITLLKQAILEHEDAIDNWLGGSESSSAPFSDEYIAFSAMRMAADFA
ncbi:hypothetical protein [Methylophilus sp. DW102]|uniref:hypothetical protein n=1 Tax=Methylophilus sp. DW102 TaxID=3095607 RepID=UPI00308D3B2D|nr:hypothetical protein MTDW_10570 [Methylophilus sp. DW102]